jgi:hypothetical protein
LELQKPLSIATPMIPNQTPYGLTNTVGSTLWVKH